ncbi:MAG TPA: S8 family serine peptidase, partial [Anaerolineales bacterium]|nr:S8 family serine peptidase [Anaerolineales bacterium]
MIKVKFSPTTATSLGQIQVNARRDKLITGMKAVDEVAESTSATNMYRLFPYDPKHESKLRKHGLHLWYVVEIGEGVDPKTAVSKFKQLREVTNAEVEREKRVAPFTVTKFNDNTSSFATLPFNDPMLKDQWHYENTANANGADINLFEAWATTAGANNVIVSVHDQGVDVNHPDLKANMWTNIDELNGLPDVDDDDNGYVDDIHGYNFQHDKGSIDAQFHGTHVAGTVAAVNNNGIGVSGVAGGSGNGDGAKIMSLQILGGAPIELSYVYAANNGAVISQNSWGYTTPGDFDESVADAIDYFIDEAGNYPGSPMKGGIVIFAAGNSNMDGFFYPAYYERVLAVSALGPNWKKASYSNFGSWIEIAAPGGDQGESPKNGVLSTIPDNQYAYIQGTSMACPHVSGVAALALANSTRQITNDELWNKLMTGLVDVNQYNPNFIDKLGLGAIDAALAIKNDGGLAPAAINDLFVTGIAQEFATLKWTVPSDADDIQPVSFTLHYHTQPITAANKTSATRVSIKNTIAAGEEFTFEANGLLGLTTYYFAVTSTDRWGNESALSNIPTDTTNEGPSIVVDENSSEINLTIDAAQSTSASHDITISNEASGILRWNHFVRQINNYPSFNASALHYPTVKANTNPGAGKVGMGAAHHSETKLRSNEPAPLYYEPMEKMLSEIPTNIIGEIDTTLTNSAAGRFYVTEADGFNLTDLQMYLNVDPAKGPVIVEIYKGNSPTKNNLIYAQEHMPWSAEEGDAYIHLNEQIYLESGSTFFVVFHTPSGNIFPLGIGFEEYASASADCFMSFDLGGSWESLEKLLDSKDFAWSMVARSYNPFLGKYISLEPGSGDIEGNGQAVTKLTASAANLVNGYYSANLVLASNDGDAKEVRIPVNVTVTGHKPDIKHIAIADFGNVFQGTTKTLELVLDNQGFGNLSELSFNVSDPQFTIVDGGPWQITAREEETIKVAYSPTAIGGVNATLTFTNGVQTYEIGLFGVGTETSKISVTPASQVIDNINLGDVVQAELTVENTGAYPLKYFIPGHDTKGVSTNWPTKFHSYGYQVRTNSPSEANPLAYAFQDISATGTKITEHFKLQNWYYEVDMKFEFP